MSGSTINFVPSGAFFIKSRTSRATLASVRGGRAVSVKLFAGLDDADLEYVAI